MKATDRPDQLVAKRVPEYGWGLFDRSTGEKLGDEFGLWYTSRKAALAARDRMVSR